MSIKAYVRIDSDESDSGEYATVNANRLNFREGPGTSHTIITTLTRGASVKILEDGTWLKVQYGGKTGYVYGKYISKSGGSTIEGTVSASVLNIRSGPGTNYTKLGQFTRGNKVSVIEKGSSWHKISYGSGVAYVYARYISF